MIIIKKKINRNNPFYILFIGLLVIHNQLPFVVPYLRGIRIPAASLKKRCPIPLRIATTYQFYLFIINNSFVIILGIRPTFSFKK